MSDVLYVVGNELEERKGNLALVDHRGGSGPRWFTVPEWINYWLWLYYIDRIESWELEARLDEITGDMPLVNDERTWRWAA